MSELQIYDPAERRLVAAADRVLALGAGVAGLWPRRVSAAPPRRILLLRLERIGDLLMSAAAIESVRAHAPGAAIDLVVGSWNRAIAERLRGIDRVETLDAPWLARGAAGQGIGRLASTAWSWRRRGYDLAINFEGDIRSHALIALAGARRRVGFAMAGGGPLLTDVVAHHVDRHTADNAAALVAAAFASPGLNPGLNPRLSPGLSRRLAVSGSTCRIRRGTPRVTWSARIRATSSSTPAAGAPSSSGTSIGSRRPPRQSRTNSGPPSC